MRRAQQAFPASFSPPDPFLRLYRDVSVLARVSRPLAALVLFFGRVALCLVELHRPVGGAA